MRAQKSQRDKPEGHQMMVIHSKENQMKERRREETDEGKKARGDGTLTSCRGKELMMAPWHAISRVTVRYPSPEGGVTEGHQLMVIHSEE